MLAFLNGQLVPESEARISVFDRGFLYGDGVFETLRVAEGSVVGWGQHWERFNRGAALLGVRLPYGRDQSQAAAAELLRQNGLTEGVLRFQLSRGVGARGYSPRDATVPTLVMTTHPMPPMGSQPAQWRLHTATLRLRAGDPLSAGKTCNRLVHVLARAEAEAAGADEALLLNGEELVAEAASANVFWVEQGGIHTPPPGTGALPGITQARVMDLAAARGISARESLVRRDRLLVAEGVFLTLSSQGMIEVLALDGRPVRIAPVTAELYRAYRAEVYRDSLVLQRPGG